MGFLGKLRGQGETPEVEAAVAALKADLPPGWQFTSVRMQMFCRRPVKLYAYGATATGPDGARALVLSTAAQQGADAVRALGDEVRRRLHLDTGATPLWAPPVYRAGEGERRERELSEPTDDEEGRAREAALALVPAGALLMPDDDEQFDGVSVHAAVVHLPDDTGLAGVGMTAADAWRALELRQRGELPPREVWVAPVS